MAILGFFGMGATESIQTEITVPEPAAVTLNLNNDKADSQPVTEEEAKNAEEEVVPVVKEQAEDTELAEEPMSGTAANVSEVTNKLMSEVENKTGDIQTMLVAGGCFWCVEADLEKTPGVISVVSGYAGGSTDNPTYNNYGSGGHREVVEVTYDASIISYEDVLIVTMKTTDPTDDDGSFGDRGDKYSAAFYYETPGQKETIGRLISEVNANGPYDKNLAIDVEERPTFWPAEDFHQDYYKGALTKLKYQYYRNASGRSDFIEKHWGEDKSPNLPWRNQAVPPTVSTPVATAYSWSNYQKPADATLKETLDALTYKVTQQDGTERAGTSPLDKIWDRGIYVDILSGEPLYSSRDKFDSGTGWPSFVAPISAEALTLHEDRKLFSVRTETRSAIADNHIGHVFNDGPSDRGGLRYCMNGAALRFVPEADMVAEGYSDFLAEL